MDAREEHHSNAPFPIEDTEAGMSTEMKLQPANADEPMDVTEDGIVTEEREVHP